MTTLTKQEFDKLYDYLIENEFKVASGLMEDSFGAQKVIAFRLSKVRPSIDPNRIWYEAELALMESFVGSSTMRSFSGVVAWRDPQGGHMPRAQPVRSLDELHHALSILRRMYP